MSNIILASHTHPFFVWVILLYESTHHTPEVRVCSSYDIWALLHLSAPCSWHISYTVDWLEISRIYCLTILLIIVEDYHCVILIRASLSPSWIIEIWKAGKLAFSRTFSHSRIILFLCFLLILVRFWRLMCDLDWCNCRLRLLHSFIFEWMVRLKRRLIF